MDVFLHYFWLIPLAYALGSISFAVVVSKAMGLPDPYTHGSKKSNNLLLGLVTIAVFLGHLYPIFHGFKGGKGVATAAGILFAISWVLGLATLGTWLIVAFFMRYSSLAALSAATFAPLYFTFLFGLQAMGLAILVMSLLLIYRHRSNIRNLMNGTETRLAKKGKTS